MESGGGILAICHCRGTIARKVREKGKPPESGKSALGRLSSFPSSKIIAELQGNIRELASHHFNT
jgi:hypothetical protein